MEKLLKRIEQKDITVGIVGLGYVGLPLAVEFGKSGIRTIGIDVNQGIVENSKLIVDTRNATAGMGSGSVIRLGDSS